MKISKQKMEIRNIVQNIERGMVEIAPLVTKHLIERFEKTGYSPVFSKDGKITEFVMEKSDLTLSYQNDFWFLKYDQSKYSGKLLSDKLLVVSKESGRSKEYDLSQDADFSAQLAKDIKQNFFK